MAAKTSYTFKPIGALATWTVALIVMKILSLGLFVGCNGVALATGRPLDFEGDVDALVTFASLAALAYLVITIVSAIFSLIWIYRAARNTVALRPGLNITPGWAVGWFFVPFANLFKPYQYMCGIWQTAAGSVEGRYKASTELVTMWWWVNLIGNILSTLSSRLPDVASSAWLTVIGGTLSVAAAYLFLRIVQTVTRGQKTSDVGVASAF